jgi:hypothetical protein
LPAKVHYYILRSLLCNTLFSFQSKQIQTSLNFKMQFHILDLPLEIVTKILSYVPTKDILLNVSLVSKSFYELSTNPSVHRSVTFTPYCFDDRGQKETAKKFLKNAICVENLFINWNESQQILSKSRILESSFINCDKYLFEMADQENLKVLEVCKR